MGGRPVRRRVLRRIGLVLLAAGLAVEGALHLVLGNMANLWIVRASEDPEVCYELAPGADEIYTGWKRRVRPTRMRVNDVGARGGGTVDRRAPPGVLRIMTFGDSFTFGQGVEEEEAFPAVIEARLEERGVPAEVINFGVPGHATRQEVALFRRRLWLRPDVALVCVFQNDLDPGAVGCAEEWRRGYPPQGIGEWIYRHVYCTRLWLLARSGRRFGAPPAGTDRIEPLRVFERSMREFRETASGAGVLPAVVFLSGRDQYRGRAPQDLARDVPLRRFDLGPVWSVLLESGDRYFIPGEDHLTVEGNRVIGTAIADSLLAWPAFRARARRVGEDGAGGAGDEGGAGDVGGAGGDGAGGPGRPGISDPGRASGR